MNALSFDAPVDLERRAAGVAPSEPQESMKENESDDIGEEECSDELICGSVVQCRSPYATGFSARNSMILPRSPSIKKKYFAVLAGVTMSELQNGQISVHSGSLI
jgi:hypothetical protein